MASNYLSLIDLVIVPLYFIVFYFITALIRNRKIENNPSYRFLIPGLMVKMFAAIAVCLVYIFYYQGGDTMNYYDDSVKISKLFIKDPWQAIRLIFVYDQQSENAFGYDIGWLGYSYDSRALAVDRFTWIFCGLSLTSYLGQSMLLSAVCYPALWRLYQMLIYEFPKLEKQMAIAVLFIPSVVFWGSGLLKDTITMAAVALFTSSLHQIIKMRRKYILNALFIIFSSYLLIVIKPYIFFALLPGSALWLGGIIVSKMDNRLVKTAVTPAFMLLSLFAGYLMLRTMSTSLGDFSVENVMEKAVVTQQDLKQDYYGGSSFDIGDFDPTVRGIIAKFPIATFTALFRPNIWEARNPGMVISAIENFIILCFTIYFLWKLRIYNLFGLIFRHHFLFFSLSFSLFFAFSVGLSTSNFGSLVRYKIPAMPFYVATLYIIAHTYKEIKIKREEDK